MQGHPMHPSSLFFFRFPPLAATPFPTNNNNNNNNNTSQYHTDTEENCACILTRNAPAYGEEALAGGFYPNPLPDSSSLAATHPFCVFRTVAKNAHLPSQKMRFGLCLCVGRAVAKNAHLPSQKTRSASCFLRRSVFPSQKTLINVQIYAPSGITWVTVAKNAPPVCYC